jgi:hypothetical protein
MNERVTRNGGETEARPDKAFLRQQATISSLQGRFATHRRSRKAVNGKVPQALRRAVLMALAEGVPAGPLKQACGVTQKQIENWRQVCALRDPGASQPGARVFSVVDEPLPSVQSLVGGDLEHDLELRLGGWTVTVRRAAP